MDNVTLGPLRQVFASTASLSLLDTSLSNRNDYCRFVWEGYAAVRWDGQISPCLPLLHDHPVYLRGRRKDVTHYGVGNINQQPVGDAWQSAEFVRFREFNDKLLQLYSERAEEETLVDLYPRILDWIESTY